MCLMKSTIVRTVLLSGLLIVTGLVASGCQTLREVANLRNVDFAIDRASDAQIAGVDLSRIRTYRDLSTIDVARLGRAVTEGELPMQFDLHIAAENPEENRVSARMVQMDWALFLNDRETVSGVLNQQFVLSPGEVQTIPLHIELDLLNFFDGGARDLFELALAIAGEGPGPEQLRIEATPTIQTPIGPIRYPEPISITYQDVAS